jgi:hypothetical protein
MAKIRWERSYGGSHNEVGNSVRQLTDGGYIIAGSSESDDGDISGHHGNTSENDFCIIKADAQG